ncbi:MAG: YceI family protein [Myxococcota bacterium]
MTQSPSRFRDLGLLLGALGVLSLGACSNPAEDVPAATVNENAAPEPAAEPAAEAEPEPEAAPARQSLAISGEASKVEFTGAKVTGSHDGGFRDFAGTIDFDPATPTRSTIEVTIQTASIFTDSDRLTGHLKSDEFFDVENMPTASFRSTAIADGGEGEATHTITGDLTLHGVTKSISFPATVSVSDAEVAATSEFAINRQDFNITYPGMPDDLIRDEVIIRLDLHAPRS